jgi:hypothetical protein
MFLALGNMELVPNNCIFNKKNFRSFLQVIPLATHWFHMWFYLRPEEERLAMDIGCNQLAMVARDFYIRCGCRANRRMQRRFMLVVFRSIIFVATLGDP